MLEMTRRRWLLLGCVSLLYLSWGSAYLATKIALEYFPPFTLVGLRFMVAGTALLAFTYARRESSKITWADVRYALSNGLILVLICSGLVAKAQETVPSGMVAILFGASPIWFALGDWLFWGGQKPTKMQTFGLTLGFCALVWLNVYQGVQSDASFFGLMLILFATLAWVYGSHLSQMHKANEKLSMLRSTGLLLLMGGVETFVLGGLLGERFAISQLTSSAYFSFAYLALFSSLVGYTTYLWLLFNSRAIVAISYEYVTPVIAIVLGAFFANEPLDATIMFTSALLILSVFFITSRGKI